MTDALHRLARTCLDAGIDAAQPARVVAESVTAADDALTVGGRPPGGEDSSVTYDLTAYDELLIVGGGNAAGTAAAALETELGARIDGGVVMSDVPTETDGVTMIEGNHPVPDETAVDGTRRLRELLVGADERTLVLAVVTGGGSALLPAPAGDLTLDDLRATTQQLLASGASIDEINAVRKHCSATKGGRLATAAAPATVAALVFSDVVGNDPAVVASGPFTPDPSTYAEARAVADRYDLDLPDAVESRLSQGVAGAVPETPGPEDSAFERVTTRLLADGYTAASAAAEAAPDEYESVILSTRVRGEARAAAQSHVAIAEQIRATGDPVAPPAVVVSGGETTVTLDTDPGRGGPNQEFALAAALELDAEGVVVAAVDTDGRDGASAVAGASVDRETVTDVTAARRALADHDAGSYLATVDALVNTGSTGTNVNDLRVLVVR